jgi:hypothetical protein
MGLMFWGWHEHRVFLRYDRVLSSGTRPLINPGVFLHTGNSPNGANPGTFIAFAQGLGLAFEVAGVNLNPAFTGLLGGGDRGGGTEEAGSFNAAFAVGSLSVIF